LQDNKESEKNLHAQKKSSIFPPIKNIILQNQSEDELIEDSKAED